MRNYGRVSPRFWTGDTGRAIRDSGVECQLIALYLMTCPSSNMIGLYYIPLPVISHETGIPIEGASKALARVCELGFAAYDHDSEMVWVVNMAEHEFGYELNPKDKRVKGIANEAQKYRKTQLYVGFYERYRDAYHIHDASPIEGPSKPHRSQKQEQKQEQRESKGLAQALSESSTAAPPPAGQLGDTARRLWSEYADERDRLRNAIAPTSRPTPRSPGAERPVADLLRAGADEGAIRNTIANAVAEAEHKGSMRWLEAGVLFTRKRVDTVGGLSLADFRREYLGVGTNPVRGGFKQMAALSEEPCFD